MTTFARTAPAFLHRRNPVAKLAAGLVVAAAALAARDPVTPALLLVGCLVALPLTGLGPAALARRTAGVLLGALSVGLANALFGSPGGWAVGGALAMRVLAIALPGVLMLSTTDPTDLADSLVPATARTGPVRVRVTCRAPAASVAGNRMADNRAGPAGSRRVFRRKSGNCRKTALRPGFHAAGRRDPARQQNRGGNGLARLRLAAASYIRAPANRRRHGRTSVAGSGIARGGRHRGEHCCGQLAAVSQLREGSCLAEERGWQRCCRGRSWSAAGHRRFFFLALHQRRLL